MTEREKFELWAESQGKFHVDSFVGRIAYEAWLAARNQLACEALADLHQLEQKVAHGCTDASCKECDA